MKVKKPKFNYLVLLIVALALFFVYSAFFNYGLNVYEDPVGTGVLVENKSSHTIRNIEVFIKENGQERMIQKIPELEPKKVSEVALPSNVAEEIEVIVKAEFHLPVSTGKIDTRELMKKSVTAKLFGPNTAFVGKSFDLEIELCNSGSKPQEVIVEENHSLEFFEKAFIHKNYSLEPNSCDHIFFEFNPKMKGETEIGFNIKAQNIIRELKSKILVS